MFLCSNEITLPHPTFTTLPSSSSSWTEEGVGSMCSWSLDGGGKVRLTVSLERLPEKFEKMMRREESRWDRLGSCAKEIN